MVSFVLLVNSLANCMDYNPNSTYNLNTNNSGYHTHQNFIPKSMVGNNQSDIGTFRYSNQNTAIAGYFNNDNLLVSRNTYDDMGLTIQKQQDAIDRMEKQLKFFQEQWEKITNQNINLEANNNQNNTDNTKSIKELNDNWSTISNCSQQTNLLETNDNTSQKNLQSETKSNTELLTENKKLKEDNERLLDKMKRLQDENQVLRDNVALAKTNLESVQGQLQIVKDNNQDLQDTIYQLYFCNEQIEYQKRYNYYWNKKLVNTNRCLRKQLSYAKSRSKSVNNSTISFNNSRSNNYSHINNIRTIANNYNISNNTKSINSKQRLNRNYSTRNLSYNSQFVPNHEQTYSELLAGQINDLNNQKKKPNKFTNKKSYKLSQLVSNNQKSAIDIINNKRIDHSQPKNIITTGEEAKKLLGENFEVNKTSSNSTHLTKNSIEINKDIKNSNYVINNDNKEDEKVVDHSDNINKWNNSEDYNNMNNINNNLEFKSIKFNLDKNNKGKLDYLLTTDKYNDKYNDKYSVITETNREDNTTVMGDKITTTKKKRNKKGYNNIINNDDDLEKLARQEQERTKQYYIDTIKKRKQEFSKLQEKCKQLHLTLTQTDWEAQKNNKTLTNFYNNSMIPNKTLYNKLLSDNNCTTLFDKWRIVSAFMLTDVNLYNEATFDLMANIDFDIYKSMQDKYSFIKAKITNYNSYITYIKTDAVLQKTVNELFLKIYFESIASIKILPNDTNPKSYWQGKITQLQKKVIQASSNKTRIYDQIIFNCEDLLREEQKADAKYADKTLSDKNKIDLIGDELLLIMTQIYCYKYLLKKYSNKYNTGLSNVNSEINAGNYLNRQDMSKQNINIAQVVINHKLKIINNVKKPNIRFKELSQMISEMIPTMQQQFGNFADNDFDDNYLCSDSIYDKLASALDVIDFCDSLSKQILKSNDLTFPNENASMENIIEWFESQLDTKLKIRLNNMIQKLDI